MKSVTFLANADLVLKCESGEIEFKRGELVDICHSESGDVWISHNEESEGKVHAFEIDLTDEDLFTSILENVILVEEELDQDHGFEELSLDALLLDEGIEVNDLMQFMVEANFKKAIRGGKIAKVPVRRVKKKLSPKQKVARQKSGKALARNPQAKKQRAKSLKIRKRMGLGESSYMLNKAALFDNTVESAAKEVSESLTSFFGARAKVKLTSESKVSVNLFNSDEANLIEALDSLDYNYYLEGSQDYRVITLFKPGATPVVESYYSESDEDDSEEKMMTVAEMYKEMKLQMKAKDESDDDSDNSKAQDLMDKFKENMDKMKDIDDEGSASLKKEMEGDYHKFVKMMK